MPRIKLQTPFIFYQSKTKPISSQRVVNWIPKVAEGAALNDMYLDVTGGLVEFARNGADSCRGSQVVDGVPYFVNGERLYSVDRYGNSTELGLITGAGTVSMANNGSLLVIVVPGGDAFVYEVDSSELTKITDEDFQTSDTVSFYRGYFVFTTTDGKQLFVSNLNSPLVFDALDFGSAEGDPDRIVTQIVDHDELSIIGAETTEVFRNVGGADFPLQVIPGALTQKGSHAKFGIVRFDNTYLFVGGGKNELTAIWRQASSSSAVKISTDAIDSAIQEFTADEI